MMEVQHNNLEVIVITLPSISLVVILLKKVCLLTFLPLSVTHAPYQTEMF